MKTIVVHTFQDLMEFDNPNEAKLFDRSGRHKVTSKKFKLQLSEETERIRESLKSTKVHNFGQYPSDQNFILFLNSSSENFRK